MVMACSVVTVVGGGSSSSCSSGCGADGVEMASVVETKQKTNSDFARLAAMGNQNNNTDLLMQAINGNKDAINTLSTNLNCDVKSIDNALCSIQNAIGKSWR